MDETDKFELALDLANVVRGAIHALNNRPVGFRSGTSVGHPADLALGALHQLEDTIRDIQSNPPPPKA